MQAHTTDGLHLHRQKAGRVATPARVRTGAIDQRQHDADHERDPHGARQVLPASAVAMFEPASLPAPAGASAAGELLSRVL